MARAFKVTDASGVTVVYSNNHRNALKQYIRAHDKKFIVATPRVEKVVADNDDVVYEERQIFTEPTTQEVITVQG